MNVKIDESWRNLLQNEFDAPYFKALTEFVRQEYRTQTIFPPASLIFNAFDTCRLEDVKVVIIGQDPYHGDGQAMGLSFSVPAGVKIPGSLINIYKEIEAEYGNTPSYRPHINGDLTDWARQGVLLLNATLTVRAHQAGSHQGHGWETFTDNVIRLISEHLSGVVFMLWGSYAGRKAEMIDQRKHLVLASAHPSPLSAYRGFLGNGHFAKANEYLRSIGKKEIVW